ncbi:MAG: serine hydrolase domain-containing protein [Candidatus Thorarchaeota archaeon]
MIKGRGRSLIILVIIGLFGFMPNAHPSISVTNVSTSAPDYWPTTGWLTSTPEEQGMNSSLLDEFVDLVEDFPLSLLSYLVIRNGYLVLEGYPDPDYNESTLKSVHSVTKIFTSALVGMALGAGNLTSLDELVVDFFPDKTIANLDEDKQSITVEHLLTMTAGFEWGSGDGSAMRDSPDWIQYVLDRPMADVPGETFNYNSGCSHLLSAIVNRTTGIPTLSYADTRLFQPLGISDYERIIDPQGVALGGSGLNITPRDMAKFGFLYLNNGTWDGEQIVPSTWVSASTQVQVPEAYAQFGYGFQWWIDPSLDAYYAFGTDGQIIWVQPKNDLIVVFTSSAGNYLSLIPTYIIAAILSPDTTTPPTTTTTNGGTDGPGLDMTLILGVSAAAVVLVIVIILTMKRRQ